MSVRDLLWAKFKIIQLLEIINRQSDPKGFQNLWGLIRPKNKNMSRGFTKEGDQEEVPLVTPRAHLPAGVINYVTPAGYEELMSEQKSLIDERKALIDQTDKDNRVDINYITAKLNLLEERINSAKIVNPNNQAQDVVAFGSKITIHKEEEKRNLTYQIVGVDEANISKNKVSFLSPFAKVLINKRVGDKISLKTPKGESNMIIERIEY